MVNNKGWLDPERWLSPEVSAGLLEEEPQEEPGVSPPPETTPGVSPPVVPQIGTAVRTTIEQLGRPPGYETLPAAPPATPLTAEEVVADWEKQYYTAKKEELEVSWKEFQAQWKQRWGGRLLVSDLQAQEWESAKKAYEENLGVLEGARAEALKTITEQITTQQAVTTEGEKFRALFQWEMVEGQPVAFAKNVDDVIAGIPAYRAALTKYYELLQTYEPTTDEERTNLENAQTQALETLEWLTMIEDNPETIMRPEQVQARLNWWGRMKAAFQATPWWTKLIPGYNILTGAIAPIMAAMPEPVRHGIEVVDEVWGSFVWQQLQAIPEFYTTGDWRKAPMIGVWHGLITEPPWEAAPREEYKEEVPGWGQLMIGLLNPVYWVGIPVAGKAVQVGLRAARAAPVVTRALPAAISAAQREAIAVDIARAWWVPEALERVPTLSLYGRIATKYPVVARRLPQIAAMMEPVAPKVAAVMEPSAAAARAALWGFGVAGKGVMTVGKAYVGFYTLPFKAAGVALRPGFQEIMARIPTMQLAALRKMAEPEGLRISYLGKPLKEHPYAQYVIEGPGVRVFARDVAEVQAYVTGKSLIPKDMPGLLERVYVQELGEVVSKAEFRHPQIIGGVIEETKLGTRYLLSTAAGVEAKPLTVITETQLLQRIKPRGVSQALWDEAQTAYRRYMEESMRMVSEVAKMDIPWNDMLKAQIFVTDRARQLAIKVSKVPGAASVIRNINAAAIAEMEAEQASIMWASILWRGSAYKGFLMSRLSQYGHSSNLLGIKMRRQVVDGQEVAIPIVTKVKLKPGRTASTALGDVAEGAFQPNSPYILTAEQSRYIKAVHETIDQVATFLEREQAKMAERGWVEGPWFHKREMAEGFHYVTRVRKERLGAPKVEVIATSRRIGALPGPFRDRVYETMMEGSLQGNVYGRTLEEYVAAYIDAAVRLVADKRLAYDIRPLGQTITEAVERMQPGLRQQIIETSNRLRFLGGGNVVEYTREGTRVITRTPGLRAEVMNIIRGKVPTEQTLQAIDRRFPEIAVKLRRALDIEVPNYRKSIKAISDETWRAAGITREGFNEAVNAVRLEATAGRPTIARVPGRVAKVEGLPVTQGELTAALQRMNVEARKSADLLAKIYEESYRFASTEREAALRLLFADIEAESKTVSATLKALKGQWGELVQMAKHAPQKVAIHEHPAMAGRLFDVEVANVLRHAFEVETNKWLKFTANVSSIMRTAIAALDFSAPFIQGLPVLGMDFANAAAGRPTFIWAKATMRHYRAFFSERIHGRYLAENEAAIAEFTQKFGGYVGGSEWYEAMGAVQALVRRIARATGREGDIPVWLLQQSYGRAERAFGAFGDVARVELWKALKGSTKQEELYTLAQTINKMTGVLDSRGLGITANQRMVESSFIFFAPRYTRAGLALMGDIFRGGLRGDLARKAFGGYLAGGMAYYMGTCFALGQKPVLDPRDSDFMTITVGSQKIGMGGFYTWALRFMANVTYAAYNDPKALVVLNRKDNPWLKAGYAKASALTNFTVSLITKRTYLGDPIETGSDYARFLAGQITPIALQSAFLEQEKANLPGYIAEVVGLRSFPKSVWDHLREMRDSLAPFAPDLTVQQKELMKERPLLWSDLNDYQQSILVRDNPDLQGLMDEVSALKIRRGDEFTREMAAWRKTYDEMIEWADGQRQVAIAEYNKNMELKRRWREADPTLSAEEISAAKAAGKTFRDKLRDINQQLAARRVQVEIDFPEVYTAFEEWAAEEKPEEYVGDVAYREYLDLLYEQEGLYDAYGNYQFDEAERRRNLFREKWGWFIWDYVQKRLTESREEPPLLQELRRARQILRPYWEIRDRLQAEGEYPIDTETQEQWVRNRLQAENVQAAHTYRLLEDMYQTNRPLYDRYRRMPYIQAIYRYAESIRVPTIDSAIGVERERWRMEHPEAEAYLWAFYDVIPLAEHRV